MKDEILIAFTLSAPQEARYIASYRISSSRKKKEERCCFVIEFYLLHNCFSQHDASLSTLESL